MARKHVLDLGAMSVNPTVVWQKGFQCILCILNRCIVPCDQLPLLMYSTRFRRQVYMRTGSLWRIMSAASPQPTHA